jgi:hypothetical protein
VELLELNVFGWENLEWSRLFESGAAWSCAKHALNMSLIDLGFVFLREHKSSKCNNNFGNCTFKLTEEARIFGLLR